MPKTDPTTSLDDYAPVADRITLFYASFPTGRIVTELIAHSATEVVFRALVYRSLDERRPAATGWASERFGDGDINTVACLENTETSAVGRALANLGLTASRRRPSLEEMEKAARARDRGSPWTPNAAPIRQVREMPAVPFDAGRQRLADRLREVLDLLREAERAGLSARRAETMRTRLMAPGIVASVVDDAFRGLRVWLARRTERALHPSEPASPASPQQGSAPADGHVGPATPTGNDMGPSSVEGSA